MGNINEIITELGLENSLILEDIPNIDLYMDQVIQLFESKFSESRRTENEKVLTKTMINNYAKGKLFIPIKNKKYSREHLILISFIYHLKGALSINDIKIVLSGINEKILEGKMDLDAFYRSYLSLSAVNVENFKEDIQQHSAEASEALINMEEGTSELLEKVLLIASLVHISNLYRRVAEKLVDEITEVKK
ncbi:DUF1836 domain-containing protein [Bacillus sp. 165]|uniref:DUF1836 domain-containing protein n=1 Tax=Bacillus sp. 165 TaxID=1529117 RepID=UPI001ADB008D|nr:DUF1836 domain-containing protein [Bacillus sp. 165]